MSDHLLLRSQPWWLKWPVGLIAIAVCLGLHSEPQPTEGPQLAFILELIYLVVVLIAQELLRPKPEFEDARPGGLGDFHFVTATEGRPVPLIWGRTLVDGPNCIWYGDIKATAISETVSTGWFSKETVISGYEYTLGVQFGLCRGPGVELVRVWLGRDRKNLVYDGGVISGESRFDIDEPELHFPTDGGVQTTVDFYPGTTTQTTNDYLKTAERQLISPMVNVPRYTGTCHIVAREMTSAAPTTADDGAYVGNSVNVDQWAFELQRFPPVFAGQLAGDHRVPQGTGLDANPMNVIYEILTNSEWGLGFLPGEVDTTGTFKTAADTMRTESNGFAMVLDKQIPTVEMLSEVERQIDGIVFLSQTTGTWKVKLARNDYTLGSLPLFDDTNSTFTDYHRATWEDTTNQITAKFNKRVDDYKESYAVAQDSANIIMQGAGSIDTGKIVSGTVVFPGCKLSDLAAQLVWRSLRVKSFPIARATFTVDRSFWELGPGDVFKWTNAELSISELPMRISTIDFGTLTRNKITISAIQDIFQFLGPAFGTPPPTEHIEPAQNVAAIPADEQVGFEAPRALVVRDLDYAGNPQVSKVFVAGRRQGPEVLINVTERHASGTPVGSFASAGLISAFQLIGALKSNLSAGSAYPLAAITIEPSPDTQTNLEAQFNDATTIEDLGTEFTQMVLINNEIMLVQSASDNGLDVDLENVYRGVMDTVQGEHTAGDDVYILTAGSRIASTSFPTTDQVHIRLLPQSMTTTLASGSANQIALTMAQRTVRPYPPSTISYNSGSDYGTPDLEGDGGAFQTFGVDVDWKRRAYDAADEIPQLGTDVDPDASLEASDTKFEIEVRHTPYGPSDVVVTQTWVAGTTIPSIFLRNTILDGSPNTQVQELEFRIAARHDIFAENDIESRYTLAHRITPDSTLTGQVAMGKHTFGNALPVAYVAAATGTFTVNIGAVFATGNVQVQLNGGGWSTVFAAGLVTGTFAGSTSDSIELRHDASDGAQLNFVELKDPSAVSVSYGIFES